MRACVQVCVRACGTYSSNPISVIHLAAVLERLPDRQYNTMSAFFVGFENPYLVKKSSSAKSKAVCSSLTVIKTPSS